MNSLNILEMNEKSRKNQKVYLQTTPSSVTNYPSVLNSITNVCHEAELLLNGHLCRLSN